MGFDRELSYYLFARPSFSEGVARTLDIAGNFDSYNTSPTPEQADSMALFQDWKFIGLDIVDALNEYGKEVERETAS